MNIHNILDEASFEVLNNRNAEAMILLGNASEHWVIFLCEKYQIEYEGASYLERVAKLVENEQTKQSQVQFLFNLYFLVRAAKKHSYARRKDILIYLEKFQKLIDKYMFKTITPPTKLD